MKLIPIKYYSDMGEYNNPPIYAHITDAGFDLVSKYDIGLKPNKITPVETGLYVAIPVGYEIQVRSKSGLASNGIHVANSPGTIDCGYSGEIKVLLHNTTDSVYMIKAGDKIAQGIVSEVLVANFDRVDCVSDIELLNSAVSVRGQGGFGSTGK